MAKQYWVGNFFVDLSRNQISQQGQPQSMPPKVLMVLTYLAQHRGRVVSYDELLENVWPNTIVTPNTLQRCVAQLRKVLGENSKAQNIIKTHAKQGYSLECEVNWNDESLSPQVTSTVAETVTDSGSDKHLFNETSEKSLVTSSDTSLKPTPKEFKPMHIFAALTVVVAIVMVLSSHFFFKDNGITFSNLRYITATDNKEYGGVYSHDGQYIIFRRYYDRVCVNDIWAKNVDALEEFRLTAEKGTYGRFTLSPDGKQLAYIQHDDCTRPITQNLCYKLMQINFMDALAQPQTPDELLRCDNSSIQKPVWTDNEHIALMQKRDRKWRIIQYSTLTGESSPFYQPPSGNLLHFAYSTSRDIFATTSIDENGLHKLSMLDRDGKLTSEQLINVPESAPKHLVAYPNFIPNQDKLFFAFAGTPYTLSLSGEIKSIDMPLDGGVGGGYFHPEGNRLMLVRGRFDGDSGLMPLPNTPLFTIEDNASVEAIAMAFDKHFNQSDALEYDILNRSVASENHAKFNPGSDTIAMLSTSTGTGQIWLVAEENSKVISQFTNNTFLENLYWDNEGKHLLTLAVNEIVKVGVDGQLSPVDFPHPVLQLFHWDSENNQAIANIHAQGKTQLVNIDLNTLVYQQLTSKEVTWAAKSEIGNIVFTDHMHRFWQLDEIEDKLIEPISKQGSEKRFVLDKARIIGVNRDAQLWSYDIDSGQFMGLAQFPKGFRYLTDIKDNQILFTTVISEKKEIIELSLVD
ncbi:MAG: hypothetical protein GJ680_16060 [Alteromonadaceae bacterium]|nr:hypothetical protein [Alteromonadaceae bacterium]